MVEKFNSVFLKDPRKADFALCVTLIGRGGVFGVDIGEKVLERLATSDKTTIAFEASLTAKCE
jgi:hypothetical protein